MKKIKEKIITGLDKLIEDAKKTDVQQYQDILAVYLNNYESTDSLKIDQFPKQIYNSDNFFIQFIRFFIKFNDIKGLLKRNFYHYASDHHVNFEHMKNRILLFLNTPIELRMSFLTESCKKISNYTLKEDYKDN
jgi:hypothetical protein